MKKLIFIVLALSCIILPSCGKPNGSAEMKKSEVTTHIEEDYGLNLNNGVVSADELQMDYGRAFEIELNKDGYENLETQLSEMYGDGQGPGEYRRPGYDNRICDSLNTKNIVRAYMILSDGEDGAKTNTTELYLAEDGSGNNYLYIFD